MPVSACNSKLSITFCTTLDLQLNFHRPLCYNSRAHCPLFECLRTTSTMLAGAHSYFVVSFKCEGKDIRHDLIPNPRTQMRKVGLVVLTLNLEAVQISGCNYRFSYCFNFKELQSMVLPWRPSRHPARFIISHLLCSK